MCSSDLSPATEIYTLSLHDALPLRVGLLDAGGADMAANRLLEVTEARQTFRFEDVAAPRAVSVNRNFSAPIHVAMKGAEASHGFLMAHDTDLFNRWEAA